MRAGPKRAVTAAPLDFSELPKSGVKRVVAFAEQYLVVPQGSGSRSPFRLRKWQQEIVKGLIPARGLRPRQGVLSLPRGNGKTALAAVLACYHLFADDVDSAEVALVAVDERQARIVFNRVRRMIELSPQLLEQTQVFADRMYIPNTDSVIIPLPALEGALQGYSPSLAIVDELAYVKDEIWQSMTLASGKRDSSLVLGISTPGTDRESIMWRLCEYGRQHPDDKAFYLEEFAAPLDADIHDEQAWKQANPALGDFLSIDALRLDVMTTREDAFKRFRMGLWTSGASAWLPAADWQACEDTERQVAAGEPVVLAFDGSFSNDSTALVGCTIPKSDNDLPHLFVVQVWEKDNDPAWRVNRDDVDAAVHDAFKRMNVIELACDPYGYRAEIAKWSRRYGGTTVIEYPSYVISRMAPSTDALATAVKEQQVTHDGNKTMAAHVAHARAKSTQLGDVITKDRRMSPRKIDAAVCAVMAFGRAQWHKDNPKKSRRLVAVK